LVYLYFATPAVDVLLQSRAGEWTWVELKGSREGDATRLDNAAIGALLDGVGRARLDEAAAFRKMESNQRPSQPEPGVK
jgi:hypothetical protein